MSGMRAPRGGAPSSPPVPSPPYSETFFCLFGTPSASAAQSFPRRYAATVSQFPQRFRQAQAECAQLDEAFGVALIVDLVFLEGDMGEAVEALGRFAPDDPRQAFIELQAHRAVHMLLAGVDERLQHQPFGRVPEAVIDELGIAWHQFVLQMRGAAVEGNALDAAMGGVQQGA